MVQKVNLQKSLSNQVIFQTLVIHFIKFDVGDWLCPGCRGCNYMEIYDENEKVSLEYKVTINTDKTFWNR